MLVVCSGVPPGGGGAGEAAKWNGPIYPGDYGTRVDRVVIAITTIATSKPVLNPKPTNSIKNTPASPSHTKSDKMNTTISTGKRDIAVKLPSRSCSMNNRRPNRGRDSAQPLKWAQRLASASLKKKISAKAEAPNTARLTAVPSSQLGNWAKLLNASPTARLVNSV